MSGEELAKILDELGQRLGPAGSHVFGLAVRQQFITGAIWSVVLLGSAFVGVVVATAAIRRVRRLETVIEAIEGRIAEQTRQRAETEQAIRKIQKERDDARLEAMTPEARSAWLTQMSGLLNIGSYGYSSFGIGS